MKTDVVVVGAGPVGLLLAGELALGGARVVVLERDPDPSTAPIKQGEMGARSLNAPSVHALRRRGLLPAIRSAAMMWWDPDDRPRRPGTGPDEQPVFAGHFAGIMLRADRIDPEDPDLAAARDGGGVIAQADLERILTDRARHLGVTIRTATAATAIDQNTEAVIAMTTDGPVTARWLVGCDGGRSVVRKQAGIAFPGDDAESVSRLALVDMTDPEALLPGGLHECAGGSYLLGGWEMRLRPTRITTIEPGSYTGDREAPVTAEELQDSIRRVCGIDTTITGVHAASRYSDAARQATTYRAGRIFLAGDAAHVHSPAGGQGLNLGIGDAMNLGWKLAAVIRGDAPEALLDTYTAERHPVGTWVQDWTKAQSALSRRDSRTQALRSVVTDLLESTAATTYVLKKLTGVTLRYPMLDDHSSTDQHATNHPVVGTLAPDLPAAAEAATDGRFVLATDQPSLTALATCWPNRITTVSHQPTDSPPVLIRPDGIVCWAGTDPESAAATWPHWLGKPTPALTTPAPAT